MMALGFKSFSWVLTNCDSTGAVHVVRNSTYSSRTKHMALRLNAAAPEGKNILTRNVIRLQAAAPLIAGNKNR